MDLSKQSDEKVALQMQQNSGNGIEQIIDRYQNKLVRYASGILHDTEKAEDVVQETFIAVYKNINSFDTTKKFSSWIYRIAHNRAINEIRKGKILVGLDEVREIQDEKNNSEVLERGLDKETVRKLVIDKIRELPIKYREVLVLRYFEDKSYEEISDILRTPKNTVGVRINRALAKIKKILNIKIEDYL